MRAAEDYYTERQSVHHRPHLDEALGTDATGNKEVHGGAFAPEFASATDSRPQCRRFQKSPENERFRDVMWRLAHCG
jgi:hypothetical protein